VVQGTKESFTYFKEVLTVTGVSVVLALEVHTAIMSVLLLTFGKHQH